MTEQQEILQVVKYCEIKYPNVILKTNYDRFKSNIWHAKQQKNLHTQIKGYPDLFIAEMRIINTKIYGGLFIEFKKSNTIIYNKKNEPKNDHLKNQNAMLNKLKDKGYFASFGIGYYETIKIIDNYLNNQIIE